MPIKSKNKDLISMHASIIRSELHKIISNGDKYALIDFPKHSNVGDSAIWLGELIVLRQLSGRGPSYVCDYSSYSEHALRRSLPEGPIFLHGGGNFGDIWPEHQLLREKIFTAFKDRIIVQLPQTVNFNSHAAAARCRTSMDGLYHPLFLVRDDTSAKVVSDLLGFQATITPDAAIFLGSLTSGNRKPTDMLSLLRTDQESAHSGITTSTIEEAPSEDWLVEPAKFRNQCKRAAIMRSSTRLRLSKRHAKDLYYNYLASGRVSRGINQLSNTKVVITDRLHGVLLCLLLGVPCVALDNNYGKVHGYIRYWLSDATGIFLASTYQDAIALTRIITLNSNLASNISK